MMDLLKYLDARLGEPSTYASIAVLLGLLHVNVPPGAIQTVSFWGCVLAGGLGVLLAEGFSGKPAAQVISDVLGTFLASLKAAEAVPPASGDKPPA